ncbi:pyruvate:ferredoxin (flavodoxin) oxidoreductase [Candidatus Zixiibacteriota bacterium]
MSSAPNVVTIDGNEAAARVAYKISEVIAIYPITPSSGMGELSDEWAANDLPNIWGTVPLVAEMQSEGGAAGAVHGSLQTGALTTTFTASQGLLLMLPNMFKIAGELTSAAFHVSARSVSAQALSIFGDHSDVMAARSTGWGMLASASIQEIHDLALITSAATLEARVPFIHFFDGFRSSHEVMKINELDDDTIRAMIDDELVRAHKDRALSPDNPMMRGTAQNPDVFFQARETVNPYYLACPGIVQKAMDRFAELTGRSYHLFDYVGPEDAERVIVIMASGAETVEETVNYLNTNSDEKVGVVKVRCYRPFSMEHFVAALPSTVKKIAVLDRTKEPGSLGEPLYQDVVTAIVQGISSGKTPFDSMPVITGGRYGLSSKEFTPAMVKSIYDELKSDTPKNNFTVGIHDDLTGSSLEWDPSFSTEPDDVFRGLFYGLGADGTVGANKNSIKIIGEETDNFAQGYFVYDSKKAGSTTVSHLRFGKDPIHSTYLIDKANFIAIHQEQFFEKFEPLTKAVPGATLLINTTRPIDQVWDSLPRTTQEQVIEKGIEVWAIDGYEVAKANKMGARVNTIMQACFFAISGILPRDEAIQKIKDAIKKTYGLKGDAVVEQNYAAVDNTLENLHKVEVGDTVTSTLERKPIVPDHAPEFVKNVTAEIIAGRGDDLPTSLLPADGTYPLSTTKWEKRNIAQEVPVWDTEVCIQCNKCVMLCPHACIRAKVYDPKHLDGAPETFRSTPVKGKGFAEDWLYTLQVAVEDCTGCGVCVDICPAKNKAEPKLKAVNLEPQQPLREAEAANWDHFLAIPDNDRTALKTHLVKDSQLLTPLFEFSGACAGCGETPYVKLLTQLFGDRTIIANATGCSSIWGGNLPTTPYASNKQGRGPAWSNSLFEDNAEFGFGMRLANDKQSEYARELVNRLETEIGQELAAEILNADQSDETGIDAQRKRVAKVKEILAGSNNRTAADLLGVADYLVQRSIWIVGGDGWAYDIGYGGLDHVLASGRNVNVLVLDTEVYSNTGGQASKATPRGAVAKFAAAGKPLPKKDLGLISMTYGNIYVAQVAMGANDTQCLKAFLEADAYPGPSLIVAYSHCIAHGVDMTTGMTHQKAAVNSGHWPLYRFDPALTEKDENPLQIDSKAPSIPFEEYAYKEARFKMLTKTKPERAKMLLESAQEDVDRKWANYSKLAEPDIKKEED